MSDAPNPLLPANQLILPIVPLRDGVLFPSTESVLSFGREISVKAVNHALSTKKLIVLVAQKKQTVNNPKIQDLYDVGTLAIVERTLKADNQINALVRGLGRVKIIRYTKIEPSYMAQVEKLEDKLVRDEELKVSVSHLQKEFRKLVEMGKPVEFLNFMKLMSDNTESELADQVANALNISAEKKQAILEELDVKQRIQTVIRELSQELKIMELERELTYKTQAKFDKHMKESVLRERLRTIQKELGETDDEEEVVNDYESKLKKLATSKDIKEKIKKEIKRLKQLSVNNPEGGYIRTWLDTIFELPWGKFKKENVDLKKANLTLQKSHYGLDEVKDRILEFIAVLELKKKTMADSHIPTILCFVGPPGVGKTSIGKSIAESLGREFVKISLGGIRDEAEIRGHRKTYVGAMPGRIISGLKNAKSMNPVFMLDEVDKIGADFRGDPSAALLEALDPEQNKEFEDHYLDLPFDLSHVLFITTANTLETIPPALRDRLEIIPYSGYTEEEKTQIAMKHLLSKCLKNNGLTNKNIQIDQKTVETIISRYTREAGVRDLERNISKIMRKAARHILEKKTKKQIVINDKLVKEYLGPFEYDPNSTEKEDQVGLVTGLAWTSVGGDVLFVEVSLVPGKGQIKLTGKLGEVMKESAMAALTYVKANAKKLGISQKLIDKSDIHIHVPEGAVPKDGPSAGITITTAIASAFMNKKVKKSVAMTGEVTLRGRVLRIGGLKEKAIAAATAGATTVIIPKENQRDLVKIPKSIKKKIKFVPVREMSEVLKMALTI